jgi:hypothetical protein
VADLELDGLFTPDSVASGAERLAAAVRTMSREIFDSIDVEEGFENEWDAFTQEFLPWKADHTSWFSRAWNTTRDELVTFVDRYNNLRASWVAAHPSTASTGFAVTGAGPLQALDKWAAGVGVALRTVGIGLAIVVGVGIVGYVTWKAAA